MLGRLVQVYCDDNLIFSKTRGEHLKHVRMALESQWRHWYKKNSRRQDANLGAPTALAVWDGAVTEAPPSPALAPQLSRLGRNRFCVPPLGAGRLGWTGLEIIRAGVENKWVGFGFLGHVINGCSVSHSATAATWRGATATQRSEITCAYVRLLPQQPLA